MGVVKLQHFIIMDKDRVDCCIEELFGIFYSNMSQITPEEDYSSWAQIIKRNLNNPTRNIVLMYDNDLLIGFFMHSITNNEIWNMEEIQIKREFQGKNNIFRRLYGFLINLLPDGIKTVTACAHKLNAKSQGIIEHMGLRFMMEDKDTFYCYQGMYEDLLNWYNSIPLPMDMIQQSVD